MSPAKMSGRVRVRKFLSIPLVVLVLHMAIPGLAHGYFMSGNTLKQLSDNLALVDGKNPNPEAVEKIFQYVGFVTGVYDSFEGVLFCTGDGVTLGQLSSIVRKHLLANPEKWDQPATLLVRSALSRAFPCND